MVRTVAILLLLALSTSCVSQQQYRGAIAQRDLELQKLRRERSDLKAEREELVSRLSVVEREFADSQDESRRQPARPQPASYPGPEPTWKETSEASAPKSLPNLGGLQAVGVQYDIRDGRAVITLPGAVSFGSGSSELTSSGKNAVAEVARTLNREWPGSHYSIEGHTDSDPIRKTLAKFASNRSLSLARAMAVLDHLVVECAIPDEHCVVVGHGQYKPLEQGSSDEVKARNRRVEIVVIKSQ